MKIYIASLTSVLTGCAAFVAGFLGVRALSRQEDVDWTDDGPCTCTDAALATRDTCPQSGPSTEPLTPLLLRLEKELWVS